MSYSFAGRYFNKYKPFFSYGCDDYAFKVDLEFGELYFTKKLISFSGKHLPLELSLKYVQRHVDLQNDYLHNYCGFPRGFKTNYHVFLEYDSYYDLYLYEDMDGFLHKFKLAENSSSLYFDTLGSGLMLITTPNGFKVFDDDGNYQLFDPLGRLVTVHKKITSSYFAEQTITYSDNLHIASITDNYGRTVNFSYSGSYVKISYNNNDVITLDMTYACLNKITKNIGGHLIEDIFNQYYFINNLTLSNGKELYFSYIGTSLTSLVSNLEQDAFFFAYNDIIKVATVTNARGIKTAYDYNQKQTVSQISQNNVDFSYLRINSDIVSCLAKDNNDIDETIDFTLFEETTFDIENFGYTDSITNNNIEPYKLYMFYAEIESNLAVDESVKINLLQDNYRLAELVFSRGTRVLAFPVGIKASAQKVFRLEYYNFSSNYSTILKARLIPLLGDFEVHCTNENTDGPLFFYGDTPYHILKDGIVSILNNNVVESLGYYVTYKDYIKNEKLFYKRNGAFHFWCNDGTELIDNATNVFLKYEYSNYFGYDSLEGSIGYYNSLFTKLNTISFYRIKGKDDHSLSISKISHNSASFHTGFTSFYYEEEETKYIAGSSGSITYYDYNENYSLLQVNRDDGYQLISDFDNHKNLEIEACSHPDITGWLYGEYFYDNDDNLIYEDKFIGEDIEEIEYSYDDFGNILTINYPNSSKNIFSYDAVTGERNIDVIFGHGNTNEFTQTNTFINANNRSFDTDDNSYKFSLSNGRLASVSYNNQQILNITYEQETYQGVIISTRETITYSNGDSISYRYDEFNRLVEIGNNSVVYSYDEYSNIVSIKDDCFSQVYPVILFTYNYYNNLTHIQNRLNSLSLAITYDDYQRITDKSLYYFDTLIYEVSYTYYTNKPDLEKVIKKSSITYGLAAVDAIDDSDAFSRLTSQKIQFGSHFSNQILTYCDDGNFTNRLVKTVTHYDEHTYPGPPIFYDPTLFNKPVVDTYSYDNAGNIVSIVSKIGITEISSVSYKYDYYSRLVRENNTQLNSTFTYRYDNNGNIISKKEYNYTTSERPTHLIIAHSYEYDETYPDRLISFDGEECLYDSVGNPTKYRNKTMTWTKGRLLYQAIDNNKTITLGYDGLGQRISKLVVNNQDEVLDEVHFDYLNGLLIRERRGTKTITYLHSHRGVVGFVLDGYDFITDGVYYYEKNIQQDVVSIKNSSNLTVAIYKYDAWGKCEALLPGGSYTHNPNFVGFINPIRYRSYYYDSDLSLYWLTTRYYDPIVGRFISPDHYSYLDYKKLHGINLYCYSKNNPVMYYDPSGHFGIFALLFACIGIVAAAAFATSVSVYKELSYNDAQELAKTADKNPELSQKDKEKFNHAYKGDGFVIHYKTSSEEDTFNNMVTIYDTWRYTEDELREFLTELNRQFRSINIERVINECLWHNVLYLHGIFVEHTKDADVYFNKADVWFGWLFESVRFC